MKVVLKDQVTQGFAVACGGPQAGQRLVPADDLHGWIEVPDEHVLTAVRGLVEMHPLLAFTEGIKKE